MGVANTFAHRMEVLGVFIEQIIGGKVQTSTEPLIYNGAFLVVHLKITPVGMDRRNVRFGGGLNKLELILHGRLT